MMASVTSPTTEPPQPRIGVSIAVAVVCFGIGVAAVVVGAGRTATHRPAASPYSNKRPAAAPAPAVAADRTLPASSHAAVTDQVKDPPQRVAPVTEVAPESRPNAPRDGAMTVIPGRVAYLRCDGLTGERGRFPCPRDVDLERAVWEALAALPTCKPSLGRGTADVRLDLSRSQGTEARVLAIPGSPEPSLDTDRVYECVGRHLTALTTSLDPIYMVISFRFAMR